MSNVLALRPPESDLELTLRSSLRYFDLVDSGAIQARHGATGPGRIWSEAEIADVRAQLGMPANEGER